MRKILRYNDLVERGICGSRMTLHRMRKDPDFPVAVEIAGGIGLALTHICCGSPRGRSC
jgi:hypothetical protein